MVGPSRPLLALAAVLLLGWWDASQAFLVPPGPHSPLPHPHHALYQTANGRAIMRSKPRGPKASTPMMVAITAPVNVGVEVKDGDYFKDTQGNAWQTIPDIFTTMAKLIPDRVALIDNVHRPSATLTYKDLDNEITGLAAGLQAVGLQEGECVSIFSENSHRWLIMDQAIMRARGRNAVRGVRAPVEELQYIYENSESVAAVVETPEQLAPLLKGDGLVSKNGKPKFLVVLYGGDKSGAQIQEALGTSLPVMTFEEVLGKSVESPFNTGAGKSGKDIATLVYTSGTTNHPKGVMLRHINLLHQVHHNSFSRKQEAATNPCVGDVFVSVLPCWHIFERTAEYWMMSKGATLVYSSVKNFKSDLVKYKPHFLVAVPRLFETIYRGVLGKFDSEKGLKKKLISLFTATSLAYIRARRVIQSLVICERPPNPFEKLFNLIKLAVLLPLRVLGDKLVWSKIREGLGGRVKVLVSGGSSLPMVLEDFFDMVKLTVIVGYGMTETSPVIANRLKEENLRGSVGGAAMDTEIKLVDVETGKPVAPGESGVVLMRGPQKMAGYMSNPEATKATIDNEGFLNTGDLGRFNPGSQLLIITGRAKDTIVLSNGENVEPQGIEDLVTAKSLVVDQMMCVGQDEKSLGAIIVPNPSQMAKLGHVSQEVADEVKGILGSQVLTHGIEGNSTRLAELTRALNENREVKRALVNEIRTIQGKESQDFQKVNEVFLLWEPFSMGNGQLTQTLKVKRNVVAKKFKKEIAGLYHHHK